VSSGPKAKPGPTLLADTGRERDRLWVVCIVF
jgi:hypothetical protein